MEWIRNLRLKRDRKVLERLADQVFDGKNEPFRHYCQNRKARPCGCMAVYELDGVAREVFINPFPNRAVRRRLKRQAMGRAVSK